jgi:hypothetical protein
LCLDFVETILGAPEKPSEKGGCICVSFELGRYESAQLGDVRSHRIQGRRNMLFDRARPIFDGDNSRGQRRRRACSS